MTVSLQNAVFCISSMIKGCLHLPYTPSKHSFFYHIERNVYDYDLSINHCIC